MSFKTIVLPLSIFRNSCKHDAISEAERITITLVQFADAARTVMVFRVVKKQNILSLRAMAAAKVPAELPTARTCVPPQVSPRRVMVARALSVCAGQQR